MVFLCNIQLLYRDIRTKSGVTVKEYLTDLRENMFPKDPWNTRPKIPNIEQNKLRETPFDRHNLQVLFPVTSLNVKIKFAMQHQMAKAKIRKEFAGAFG